MSYRILIVDDDDLFRVPLERAIGAAGFETLAVASGEQALDHVVSGEVDLVLTERLLPRMDGLHLLWRIKAEFPSVAVIVMTEIGSTRSVAEAMRLGAEDYFVKPFETDTLLTTARRAIESPARGFADHRKARVM
jgi:DNA-binding NtrC family response regulator